MRRRQPSPARIREEMPLWGALGKTRDEYTPEEQAAVDKPTPKRTDTVKLPWPPSVNHYWRMVPGQGVLVSQRGRQYREDAGWAIQSQRMRKYGAERVAVALLAFPPDRRRRDIENVLKAAMDALEACQVFNDDEQIDKLTIERREVRKDGELWVRVTPAGPRPAQMPGEWV